MTKNPITVSLETTLHDAREKIKKEKCKITGTILEAVSI
jgi:CBS domain-containing protein